jgi:DNA-binding CsgD family transcriptional regulator/tetratricopeptide (TPR) repeat protein
MAPVVLRELGETELSYLDERAIEHLRAARELTTDVAARAEMAEAIALGLYHADGHVEGVEAALGAIEEVRGNEALREQWLRLEAVLALISRYDLETEERTRGRAQAVAAELDGSTQGERLVKAIADAERPGLTAQDLYEATLRNERVLDETPWPDPIEGIGLAAMYLHAGRPDAAATFVEKFFARSREEGSPLRYAIALAARGMVAADVGELRSADEDFETSFEAVHDLGDVETWRRNVGMRLVTLAGLGEFERGEALLTAYDLNGDLPEQMFYNPALYSRGILRLAQRRFEDAEADFRELGRRHERWQIARPVPPWRSAAAEALIATGRTEEARALAAEELDLAMAWDTPKAIAIATRALALSEATEESIAGLTEAVELLEDTPWRLERARTRCDLGSALRRSGSRRAGREALALAMDEAYACGAEPLAERAAEELRASGARPRRRAISGLEALTPSERRVADLAAAGRTNREIAQELFVTMATVETHLTRVYRKLDLTGRDGLAVALEGS